MKKIKTFEDACKKLGKDPNAEYTSSQKIDIITEAIVGKWKADYSNGNQWKLRPWFIYDKVLSAFRFDSSDYVLTVAGAGSGVRRVFETEEQSDYAGKTFIKEYNDELLGK